MEFTDVVLEDVSNALAVTLKQALPAALVDVQAEQAAKESAWAEVLGPFAPLVALPEPVTWFVGHYPSLLDRPMDQYPLITVLCFDSATGTPADPYSVDQGEVVLNRCFIEFVVTDIDPDPAVSADRCNRIAQRYLQAMTRAVTRNDTLGGAVAPLDQIPHGMLGGVSRRRTAAETDALACIQVGRIEYTFKVPQQW